MLKCIEKQDRIAPRMEPLSPQDSMAIARWAHDNDASLEDATVLIRAMTSVRYMLKNLAESDFVTEHGKAPFKTLEGFVMDMALDIANTYPQEIGREADAEGGESHATTNSAPKTKSIRMNEARAGQTVVTLWKDKETISRSIGLFDTREEAAAEGLKLLPSYFAVQLHTLEAPTTTEELQVKA